MPHDSDEFDLFISYARNDNASGWITRFIEQLLEEHLKFTGIDPTRELKPFFDKRDIRSLDDWKQRIFNDGLAKSRLFVAFISPNYFASEWCRREWKAWIDTEIAKHILSAGAAPIYLIEVPGFVGKVPGLAEQAMLSEQQVASKIAELCGLPKPYDGFAATVAPIVRQMRDRRQITSDFVMPFRDEGVEALRRADLHGVLQRLAQDLDHRVQDVKRAAESETNVPPYNKKFSGRLDELLTLRDRLKDDRAGVISSVHGLGGIGKTELAFTYAHAFASAYPGGRFLVRCEGKTSLRDAALALGDIFRDRIRDEERKTAETYFAAITACLRERLDRLGHMLLVLDNVTDPALVTAQQADSLTALGPKLHLLATTRLAPQTSAKGNWLTLGELPEADALDLLEKHRSFASDAERVAAQRIVKWLGGFTLAVELVAAWLATHEQSSNYSKLAEGLGLEDLEEIAGQDDLQLRRHNHERRLTAVLGPVLAALKPAERRALEYAALLPPDCVPLPWLKTLVTQDFPELSQPNKRTDPWAELVERVMRLALFTRAEAESTEPRLVRVHRLVQELVRRKAAEQTTLSPNAKLWPALLATTETLILKRCAASRAGLAIPEERWELTPLLQMVEKFLSFGRLEAAFSAASWLSIAFKMLDRFDESLRCLRACAEKARSIDCPVSPDGRLSILRELAETLKAAGEMGEATAVALETLSLHKALLGVDDWRLPYTQHTAGGILLVADHLQDAEHLLEAAVIRGAKIDEIGLLDWATFLDSYASVLHRLGKSQKAAEYAAQVIEIWSKHGQPGHPALATFHANLAAYLSGAGNCVAAKAELEKALSVTETAFGPLSNYAAKIHSSLSCVNGELGDHAEARRHARIAVDIGRKVLPSSHPDIGLYLMNLAAELRNDTSVNEVMKTINEALKILDSSLGESHPLTLAAKKFKMQLGYRILE